MYSPAVTSDFANTVGNKNALDSRQKSAIPSPVIYVIYTMNFSIL